MSGHDTPAGISPLSPPSAMDEAFGQIADLLEQGRMAELIERATVFGERHPGHFKAKKLLGFAFLLSGDVQRGLGALQQAVAIDPSNAEAFDLIGCAHNMMGNYLEADEAFKASLKLDAGRAESWGNLGKNLSDQRDHRGAVDAYSRALTLDPTLVRIQVNLGASLCEIGKPEEALKVTEQAITLDPANAWAFMHRGNALKDLFRLDAAIADYRHALMLDAGLFQAWLSLADAFQKKGEAPAAQNAAERAYAINPEHPDVLNCLGTLYAISDRTKEAEGLFRRALDRQPDNAVYWVNLGSATEGIDDKLACYKKARDLQPSFVQAQSQLLFCLNYFSDIAPAEMLAEAQKFGQIATARIPADTRWANDRDPVRPLRIGVVSGDLCTHPAAYFLDSTLEAFKGRKHQWFAYSNVEQEDAQTERFRGFFSHWCDCQRLTDAALAKRIKDDGIDILIDLAGHSAANRLPVFAYRPAPVQVAWLGYFATTGMPTMDWIIADACSIREGEERHYSEPVWRLPDTRFCFTPPKLTIPVSDGSHFGGSRRLTFGNFSTLIKANDKVLALWAKVMSAVPEAQLLIKAKQLDDATERQRLTTRLGELGVTPDRLILEGRSPREAYLRTYHRVDICLDTFPFAGGTTTAESLWMGVPVLTLAGQSMVARQSESMLNNVALAHWVAANEEDFVRKALAFSQDRATLTQLRLDLRHRLLASPLGNAEVFANRLEAALCGMWQNYCKRT